MKTRISERWGTHPHDVRNYDTERLRGEFLVESIFEADSVLMTYTHNDRLVIGGASPVAEVLSLPVFPLLKSEFFCERREVGIVCIGGSGVVRVDGRDYRMSYKDALYVGRGKREVLFINDDVNCPAKFYFASAPAHKEFPTSFIGEGQRRSKQLGSPANSNERMLNQLILNEICPCCQLQMGLTELAEGSVWNTMPAHTHSRRMEAYLYFNVPEGQSVLHLMGEPTQTRHIFVHNGEAVISPSWSIHSAAGTSAYSFVWAMCGENLDYNDMDVVSPDRLL